MVHSIDNNINRPNYNAVNISIKKPEVNVGELQTNYSNDNGIYSAVNIEIDNPSVNNTQKNVYDYPIAEAPVMYDLANINRIPLPQVSYHTTNVILPKMENEVEFELPEAKENNDEVINFETEENETKEDEKVTNINQENVINTTEEKEEDINKVEVPAPNYTTIEAEKGDYAPVQVEKKVTEESVITSQNPVDNISNDVKIMKEEVKSNEVKRPEIIPGEEILPEVDIPLVISNLTSPDFDIQALQMEEIARISLDNPENAMPYIVRDVFSNLIEITKKDTTNLTTPTEEQVQARKKLIANIITLENSKNNKDLKLPYQLSEKEIELANELSPMEQAERNKEYALYTISILSKIYTDEVEKQTGNIIPMTDLPGSAAIVDALRYSPNSGVKIAAIDALRHIQRPEYKEELTTLYTLAQADTNPEVAYAATRALDRINNI